MKPANYARLLAHFYHSLSQLEPIKREALKTASSVLDKRSRLFLPNQDWFILGSGSSVLELETRQWTRIKDGISIGLNSWAFHTFVPDVLAIEEVHGIELELQRRAMSAGLRRIANSSRHPLILKFRSSPDLDMSLRLELPNTLLSSVKIYGRLQVPPLQYGEDLRIAITHLLRLDDLGLIPPSLLIDQGASVARMIHFAVRCGARRIFLVGVDLGVSPYFFEKDPSFLDALGVDRFVRQGLVQVHGTQLERKGSRPVAEFLSQMARALASSKGVEVLALNGSAELLRAVPPG